MVAINQLAHVRGEMPVYGGKDFEKLEGEFAALIGKDALIWK